MLVRRGFVSISVDDVLTYLLGQNELNLLANRRTHDRLAFFNHLYILHYLGHWNALFLGFHLASHPWYPYGPRLALFLRNRKSQRDRNVQRLHLETTKKGQKLPWFSTTIFDFCYYEKSRKLENFLKITSGVL